MTSSPAKQVRFYKIGGFKQTDPYKNQNFNPFQFGYANQYPFMFYQNQPINPNSVTPKKQTNTPLGQSLQKIDNKTSKNVNQLDKRQNMIEDDDEIENQLETIEEENLVITRKKNPTVPKDEQLEEDQKLVEKERVKEEKAKVTKEKEQNKAKEPTKPKETIKAKEPVIKEKISKTKKIDKENLIAEPGEKKKELVEKYETIEKTKIETPRSKDGKPFSIRGTTKTVIEVTTTEIVDESIFKTKEDSTPKLIKKTPELKEQIEDKKDQDPVDDSNKQIENNSVNIEEPNDTLEEIIESNDKNIQTDENISKNVKEEEIKRAKSFSKKVDKETETNEPKVDKFLDDEPSFDEKPRVKKKIKRHVEPSKPTDDEDTPRRDKLRSKRDNESIIPKKRISQSLDDRKKIEPVKFDQEHKIVIKNLDKTQVKKFEKKNNDFKFPSLVTEKQAPHRFKLKFASNESVHNSYDGYKRCPCLMHNRRYYEKFGIPPDHEPSNLRPQSIKADHSFSEHSNHQFEKSFILSDRNGKYSQRNKTNLEKYIDGHFYQNLNQSFRSDSEMILRPSWNEAF